MKNKKEFKNFWKFAKKIAKEVDQWPAWKKAGMERLMNHRLESSKNHCGCGYTDCNNRGY
jgi:hypothetical protein